MLSSYVKQRILVDELVVGVTNSCCVVVRVVNFTAAGAKYRSVTEEQKGVMQTNISNYQVTHLSNLGHSDSELLN